jgi:putative ABC transport system ATP-binding protein
VEKQELARAALEKVGLATKADRLPGQISGGEAERVAIARAIVNEPAILMADEPTGNLDSITSGEVMRLLRDLNAQGMTIVMVTHSHDCATHAKRLVRIADGRIVEDTAPNLLSGTHN